MISLTSCQRRAKVKAQLLETLLQRDGADCFLCHLPLGDDMTKEHLLSQHSGGGHQIANLALAHKVCNEQLGHLSVMEKIKAREKKRQELDQM